VSIGVTYTEDFERDLAMEHRVFGRIDLGRPSSAEVIQDAVTANAQDIHIDNGGQHVASGLDRM
jgi:hypothetical protein